MARSVELTSGSIFNGNPITLLIKPEVISGSPTFHRVIIDVVCGMSGGNYETIRMSAPVVEEKISEAIEVDISSALRTFRDSYVYTAEPTTYPLVKFRVMVYDEYMLNGVLKQTEISHYPDASGTVYSCTLFGGFSDLDRLLSGATKAVKRLSRKPQSMVQLVAVGETFAYTPPYPTEQSILDSTQLEAPTSQVLTISKEGYQNIEDQQLFALPQTEASNRQVFRFINSFGVLESISVCRAYSRKMSVTSTQYDKSTQEKFNSVSRTVVKKSNDQEHWIYQTDPLDEYGLEWYVYEFLMAEHVWMIVDGAWLPVILILDDEITLKDDTENTPYTVSFKADFDFYGSPLLKI